MNALSVLVLAAAVVFVLYMIVRSMIVGWEARRWLDGYTFAYYRLERHQTIQPRERGTGPYARGVDDAMMDHVRRGPRVFSGEGKT